jgi:Mg-chelatase subunit ChlD
VWYPGRVRDVWLSEGVSWSCPNLSHKSQESNTMANRQTNLTLSYRPSVTNANVLQVMASIHPETSQMREPVDICCVIDISGSMGSSASAQGVEDAGLTVLDIVKHAVRTVFSCLNDTDRLSIVSYATKAAVELPLTLMDQAGKDAATQVLERLHPTDSTNIWDGLLTGMETFPQKMSSGSRNSALFLLTDGAPNIYPPKGHLPSMKDYKDSHGGVYPATISTFGFGYNLKSELLNDIAMEGGGSYSFIPDSGFVGTIFVNALSNQLNSFAKYATLSLEVTSGAQLLPETLDSTCSVVTPTSWGALLSIGNLPYNQRRDFIFSVDISNWNRRGPFVELTFEFEPFTAADKVTLTSQSEENDLISVNGIEEVIFEANLFRSSLIERMTIPPTPPAEEKKTEEPKPRWGANILKKFVDKDETVDTSRKVSLYREVGEADPLSIALAEEMRTWCDTLELRHLPSSEIKPFLDFVNGMYLDLTGEINLAFEDRANYNKWGKHYLPSIRRAHQLQQCNNFKDPGVQFYGGPLFTSLRDQAEDIFCTLPAPTPSRSRSAYRTSRAASASASAGAVPAPAYDMRAYMNAAAGCVSGNSKILLSEGTIKLMKEIRKGDLLRCNVSVNNPNQLPYEAPVECFVKTRCHPHQPMEMVKYLSSGLMITPWHPVYLPQGQGQGQGQEQGKWTFPFDSSQNKMEGELVQVQEEYVYNLVLGTATVSSAAGVGAAGAEEEEEESGAMVTNSSLISLAQRGQSYIANGIECISLAHGIYEDSVAQHSFYGTEQVVKALKALVGEETYGELGEVSMDFSQIHRDSYSGLVCSYAVVDH